MASLSYREKTLYASLAAELVIYGLYFFLHRQNSLNKVAGMIAGIIALQILLQALIALATRNRMTDERDRLIQLRGYRAGYITIAALMLLGLGLLWAHAAAGRLPVQNPRLGLHLLSVFFGMLVIADITKTATQIAWYRRAL
jgi:EamA domain-containing membrane protein RarD